MTSARSLELKLRDVHLWFAVPQTIVERNLADTYRQLLSDDERARERRFHFERDRNTFLVTRVLVRTVLSKYDIDVPPERWRFEADDHGRPALHGEAHAIDGLSFNITHTDGLVGLVLARGRATGIDAEKVNKRPAPLELAEHFFAAAEAADLRRLPLPEQGDRFYEYWTLKESYIKARGLGLSLPLQKFSFDIHADRTVSLSVDPSIGDTASRWQFWQFRPSRDHVAAVCIARVEKFGPELSFRSSVPLVADETLEVVMLRNSV